MPEDAHTDIDQALRDDELADSNHRAGELQEKLDTMGGKTCPACSTHWEQGEGHEMPKDTKDKPKPKPKDKEPPPAAPTPTPAAADPADEDDDGVTGWGI
jgi:hypothetical protein